jgi:hypothetical protein
MSRRAVLILGLGLILVTIGHRAAPTGTLPLYDGVVVEDPYRYLQPPDGAPGHPSSVSDSLPVTGSGSPSLYSATLEQPPQAQVIAEPGALDLPAGTTTVKVTIDPVPPPDPRPPANAAGNVYRFAATSQDGTPLTLIAGTTATVVMRAPASVTVGSIYQLIGDGWQELPTSNGGLPDLFSANVSGFGEFVIVASAAATGAAATGAAAPAASTDGASSASATQVQRPPILLLVAAGLALLALALLAVAATLARGE